jgi:ComF family protein
LLTIRAACHFQDPIPRIIHQFKYEGQFGLGRPLGRLLARQWRPLSPPVDVVAPIPLHPDRRRARGYNQSALLVQSLCETMEWTHQVGALERVQRTRPQVGLDAHQRRSNVREAFQVTAEAAVRDRHILLIDDVCTTGATLVAAGQTLLDAGARTVSGYCVARAR